MTSAAPIIPFPVSPGTSGKPEKASFTRLDNDTDMEALYELPNALVKPALCLLQHRHMRPLHWGEVATIIGRSATQTREALTRLAELGFAVADGDLWSWAGSIASRKPVRKSNRKPVRKSEFSGPENAGVDSVSLSPKEVKEVKKEDLLQFTCLDRATAGQGIDGQQPTPNPTNGTAPDGATPGGATLAFRSQGQFENAQMDGENMNVPGNRNIPPGPREAMSGIQAAGLIDVWRDWVRLSNLPTVSQVAQARVWHAWIQDGQHEQLRAQALHIIEAGNYGNPFAALRKRMKDAALPPILPTSTAPLAFREGQTVRYPDGTEAEVLNVRPAGISTTHPTYPDVPVGRLHALEVVE